MKQIILLIIVFPFSCIKSQILLPGGVKGSFIWEITENKTSGEVQWKSNLNNTSDTGFIITGKSKTINNNPALCIDAESNNTTIDLGKLKSFSFFTVCQVNDSLTEKVILNLGNDTAPEMVLTNQRMAALDVYRYMNYNKNNDLLPKIYVYTQNKSKDSAMISHRLQLGRPPVNQNIPVTAFKGTIPELVLFDRYLSHKEQVMVQSYLALKYGISLNQEFPVSYLNSRGEMIWDADANTSYKQNIAGIGRDDVSGLVQKVSESTQTPGVMKIGLTAEMNNNSFLIWSDNGQPLRFADGAGIRLLLRKWKISAWHSQGSSVFAMTDVMSLSEIHPLREGETFWMMVDRSGSGNFPFKQTGYFQCQPMIHQKGTISFNHLIIDPDSSGSDLFTLLAAPVFFTRSLVLAPNCSSTESGTIQTEIIGGMPPYKLNLKTISQSGFQKYAEEQTMVHTFEGLNQGTYLLEATDANNNIFNERIWVSNTHLWENNIEQSYKLTEGETLVLDASKGMPAVDYAYSWTFPDGSVIYCKTVSITQPGSYLLSVTDDNGCNSTVEILVKQVSIKNIKTIELFPNPTSDWFVLRIELQHAANVQIVISDYMGKTLKQIRLQNNNYYWYCDKMKDPGLYFIVLTAGNEKETLKLVVQ
jgi:hypothetical protein